MEMIERTLGEICDEGGGIIRTGPFGTQLHQSDYKEDGVPVVMPKNIIGDKLLADDIARIGEEDVARLSQHVLNEGDIVYGRRGDIGRQALITHKESGWLCGTGCLRISLGNSVMTPKFLHYYLRQADVIGWIYNQAIGTTMPNLNTGILRSVPIKYPPIEAQRKIASILSAYDDLIENNTRRIKILEEMVQAIYREWFVNFRYPGHEKVKMVDSPLGRVPEGWEVKTLAALIKDNIGGGWGKEEQEDNFTEPAWVIRGTDIPGARHCQVNEVPHRYHTNSNLKSRRLQPGDIVFEVSGGSKGQPVGRSLLMTRELLSAFGGDAVICASFCKRVEPRREDYGAEILYSSFVEGYSSGEIEQYQVQSTGISIDPVNKYLNFA